MKNGNNIRILAYYTKTLTMAFLDRLSNGWKLAMSSFKILRANTQLIIFPFMSAMSLILIIGSFVIFRFAAAGWDVDNLAVNSPASYYGMLFIFYVINYFVVVFFNMALIHCTRLYLQGEEPTVAKGLQFSVSRIRYIFSWALLAATVGLILKAIQENSGIIGKIITGLIGVVWSVATFFVVPVIAYENLGPIDAVKRSSELIKAKWGESLGAGFSFGLINFLAVLLICFPLGLLGWAINPVIGIGLGLMAFFIIMAISSAAKVIFVGAVYHNLNGDVTEHFDQQLIDNLFIEK